jgi:ATP-binding cassette subfamily C protein LapB
MIKTETTIFFKKLIKLAKKYAEINGVNAFNFDKALSSVDEYFNIISTDQKITLSDENIKLFLEDICLVSPRFISKPNVDNYPLIALSINFEPYLILSESSTGNVVYLDSDGIEFYNIQVSKFIDLEFNLDNQAYFEQGASVTKQIIEILKDSKGIYFDAILATFTINILAIATSLFVLQVYDLVIPSKGYYTLVVLLFGVMVAIIFELICKIVRSNFTSYIIYKLDTGLAYSIFDRLLGIRLDQFPKSVGSLSSRINSYESIRTFLSSTSIYVIVDAPFIIIFLLIIAIIGSPIFSLIMILFILVSLFLSFLLRKMVLSLAETNYEAANLKTGLLVEVIDGFETIKSTGSRWSFLAKWKGLTTTAISNELKVRALLERTTLLNSFVQQTCYIVIVAVGAYLVAENKLSMGALIATTILAGRVISPISSLPNLISQYSGVVVALNGLKQLYSLNQDYFKGQHQLNLNSLVGKFLFKDVSYFYDPRLRAIKLPKLEFKPYQSTAIIGPIGSGKSTLLKLCSGLYKPSEGRILLDNLDLQSYSKGFIAKNIGYLSQDCKLFNRTLRENITLGLTDPGDDRIKYLCELSGLIKVISEHPDGLDMMISEGGGGLSGGQIKLVAFTRLMLLDPLIWLLDEPTESMDSASEKIVHDILRQKIKEGKILIVVSHKVTTINLFERLIFMHNHQIMIDGERDWVFSKLKEFNSK